MKDKVIFISGISFYIISFIFIIIYLFMEFSIIDLISLLDRLKFVMIISLFMYLGCFLLHKENKRRRYKLGYFNLWMLFILYIIMLLNMTLFDSYFGRINGSNYLLDFSNVESRLSFFSNFIPFETISDYFIALAKGRIGLNSFMYNIFGNIIAFMPLALFIPKLIPIINKWYRYFIFLSVFIMFIEIMQFILNVGMLDIDDYILNVLGGMLCYCIIKIKCLDKFINKVLYLNN